MQTLGRILVACAVLLACECAIAQTTIHDDGEGTTTRVGNTTIINRNDGTSATITRIGNQQFYSSDNGTTGHSTYGSAGRFDSYSNLDKGWHGSGYSPYTATPGLSTYQRQYYGTANPQLAPVYPGYPSRSQQAIQSHNQAVQGTIWSHNQAVQGTIQAHKQAVQRAIQSRTRYPVYPPYSPYR